MLNSFFLRLKEQSSDSLLFLIFSSFFLRLVPALLFFGSSEISGSLHYFENAAPGRLPLGTGLDGISAPMKPVLQWLFPLQGLTGIPLVFWLKFPGIIGDISIVCTIYLLVYRATQDQQRAFSLGLMYAFHPLSIFITAFAGSYIPVAVALVLASYCFFFVTSTPALSAVLFGTATAVENSCVAFLPVFLLKAGKGATSLIFLAFFILAFSAWELPVLFSGTWPIAPLNLFQDLSKEPYFGLSLALKGLATTGEFFKLLPESFMHYSSLLYPISSYCVKNFPFLFLAGLIPLLIYHKKYNAFVFSANLILWTIMVFPAFKPYHLLLALPFSLLVLGGRGNILFLAASTFLVSWYSAISVESGTFSGVKFINHVFSNGTLFQEEWMHWTLFISGNIFLPISLWFCLVTLCFLKSNEMDQIKAMGLGKRALVPFSSIMAAWLVLGNLSGLGLFPRNEAKQATRDLINNAAFHASQYGDSFYYRNTFQVDSEMKRATIKLSSDDFVFIYLNGNRIYSGYGDRYPYHHGGKIKDGNMSVPVDLTPFLRQGRNILGIESINVSARPPGGLAVAWEIDEGRQMEKFSLPFFKGWKAKAYPTNPGWTRLDFDDSHWEAPSILDRKKNINFLKTPWKGSSQETALFIPMPALPDEFFFMLPKDYYPATSSIDMGRLWIWYCVLFFFMQYFIGKKFSASYLFFQGEKK